MGSNFGGLIFQNKATQVVDYVASQRGVTIASLARSTHGTRGQSRPRGSRSRCSR